MYVYDVSVYICLHEYAFRYNHKCMVLYKIIYILKWNNFVDLETYTFAIVYLSLPAYFF